MTTQAELKLDPQRVETIFMDCLFRAGEDTNDHVKAEGITGTVGFHPARLESHKDEVVGMLNELPEQFHEKTGGGWSFLNACNDRHGNQWTGLHQRMEQLFQLGIAIDRVKSLTSREMWGALPDGMPYYVITGGD